MTSERNGRRPKRPVRPVRSELPAPTGGMLLAKRPTGIAMAFVVVVLGVLLQTLPRAIAEVPAVIERVRAGAPSGYRPASDPVGFDAVLALASFAIVLLWLWFWVRVKERRSFASLGFGGGAVRPGSNGPLTALAGFGIGVGMISACLAVPVLAGQATLAWAAPDARVVGLLCLLLVGFLVQGSAEEVLTRGYLTQAVVRRWGLVAAIVVQAVFFTLLHGVNAGIGIVPIVNLLLFSCFASLLSLANGSLWGVCGLHAAWNFAQGHLFGVAVSGMRVEESVLRFQAGEGSSDLLTGGAFGMEGSLVTTAAYLIGTAIAWRVWRARRSGAAIPRPSGLR